MKVDVVASFEHGHLPQAAQQQQQRQGSAGPAHSGRPHTANGLASRPAVPAPSGASSMQACGPSSRDSWSTRAADDSRSRDSRSLQHDEVRPCGVIHVCTSCKANGVLHHLLSHSISAECCWVLCSSRIQLTGAGSWSLRP